MGAERRRRVSLRSQGVGWVGLRKRTGLGWEFVGEKKSKRSMRVEERERQRVRVVIWADGLRHYGSTVLGGSEVLHCTTAALDHARKRSHSS